MLHGFWGKHMSQYTYYEYFFVIIKEQWVASLHLTFGSIWGIMLRASFSFVPEPLPHG